ncbi:hypothetical protein Zmor_022559 [Zophobas morio]|uniref:SHSP domain-containing protein n=1 Tax=Zophobas morio TaxID=2755281 RepID=A0AA38M6J9_9CUCU|nr:hypothetical protein Zmor_022559 [Zophobas morio]
MWFDPFDYSRPSRLLDQRFGLSLEPEDLFSPMIPREFRNYLSRPAGYLRPWRSAASERDAGSTLSFAEGQFQANLDVQQFKPDEITVRVVDNTICVEGKHEEKEDEHGYISRHFMRRYVVPRGHDLDKVESRLSSDGVLTITAPKIGVEEAGARSIAIVQTGQPSKVVEKKEEERS